MFYREYMKSCTHLANEKLLTVSLLDPTGACSHMAACTWVWALRGWQTHLCIFQNVLSQLYISGDSDYLLCTFICWYIASTYQQRCYQNIWGRSMWRAAARQPKGWKETWRGSSSSLSVKGTFFLPPPPLLTLIAVQLKLPQFKYSWEYIELLGDAIGLHSAEVSRHKNPLSMSKIQL